MTDSVFPNLDTERAILAREGAEIAASQCGSVADAVARALRGERPKVLANPEVWARVRWKHPGT